MLPFHYRQGKIQLDFNALDVETGHFIRCKVYLTKITGFGIEHEVHYSTTGHFRKWQRWGYLVTDQRKYRVSPKLIKSWQRVWRWQLLGKRLRLGRKQGPSSRLYRAVDWEFKLIAISRRGGSWPRKWRPGTTPYEVVTPVEELKREQEN